MGRKDREGKTALMHHLTRTDCSKMLPIDAQNALMREAETLSDEYLPALHYFLRNDNPIMLWQNALSVENLRLLIDIELDFIKRLDERQCLNLGMLSAEEVKLFLDRKSL